MKKLFVGVGLLVLVFSCAVFAKEVERTEGSLVPVHTQDAVDYLYQNGLTKFNTEQTFMANQPLRRDEAAAFFARFVRGVLHPIVGSTPAECMLFIDLDDGHSDLKSEMISACQLGLFKGHNGKFMPTALLTNAQALAVLVRLVDGMKSEDGAHRADNYLVTARSLGLTKGLSADNRAKLDENITRGDVAKLIEAAATYKTVYMPITWVTKGYIDDTNSVMVGADEFTDAHSRYVSREEKIPILCYAIQSVPTWEIVADNAAQLQESVALSQPTAGTKLTSSTIANEYCVKEFGEGWTMVDTRHSGMTGFWAKDVNGGIHNNTEIRFWVAGQGVTGVNTWNNPVLPASNMGAEKTGASSTTNDILKNMQPVRNVLSQLNTVDNINGVHVSIVTGVQKDQILLVGNGKTQYIDLNFDKTCEGGDIGPCATFGGFRYMNAQKNYVFFTYVFHGESSFMYLLNLNTNTITEISGFGEGACYHLFDSTPNGESLFAGSSQCFDPQLTISYPGDFTKSKSMGMFIIYKYFADNNYLYLETSDGTSYDKMVENSDIYSNGKRFLRKIDVHSLKEVETTQL